MITKDQMRVTVKRSKLLKKLYDNHRNIFLEAQKGYRESVIKKLDRMLSDAKSGKRIDLRIDLPAPIDQTKEYDQAIAMFEMSIDDNVVLDQSMFACYVLDDWSWKDQFTRITNSYLGG